MKQVKRSRDNTKTIEGFRVNPNGEYIGFIYYDALKKKNIRVGPKSGFPSGITSIDKAWKERKKIEARLEGGIVRAKKRIEWLGKFKEFDKEFERYREWRIKSSPRGWKTDYAHLKNHVFPFFLWDQNLNNPATWYFHYYNFKDWLDRRKSLRANSKTNFLSANTKNNIVRALNSFFLYLEKVQRDGPFMRCESYPERDLGFRGIESVYSNEELKSISSELKKVDVEYKIFFDLLNSTGMRANEAGGLHAASINFREIPDQERWLFEKLQNRNIDIYGFIILTDQPKNKAKRRAADGITVERVPLKGKKAIKPLYNRIIPLMNPDSAADIKGLLITERQKFEKKVHGDNIENYLLFSFDYPKFYKEFKKTCDRLGLKNKDVHSLRHTFSTNFTKKMGGDPQVNEKILGHSMTKVTLGYLHLAEELETKHKTEVSIQDLSEPLKPLKF